MGPPVSVVKCVGAEPILVRTVVAPAVGKVLLGSVLTPTVLPGRDGTVWVIEAAMLSRTGKSEKARGVAVPITLSGPRSGAMRAHFVSGNRVGEAVRRMLKG